MPVIKSAQKKMRKDVRRTARNAQKKTDIKGIIKNTRRAPSQEGLASVYSALDKAVKTHLIHANKAARLKSRLSHLLAK